ncbi:MAG: xanthine dehydrogenase family protein molybdopterin-binding subunit [Methylobacteriaceae bacterium]|nr:xanthine dehydrogenase family protein molybdopterin-binding subunit [Methylobacteriaceae bacterium]
MKPQKFGIGQPVRRLEDARFISGAGKYTADVMPDGALAACFLRSPHAHARFTIGDLAEVHAMPGVRLVLTAADITHLGGVPCLAPMPNADGKQMALPDYPVLANGEVRHVGDAVAMVVADTEEQARVAAETIAVTYEEQKAIVDLDRALDPSAPLVWPDLKSNIAYENAIGSADSVAPFFKKAAHVVSLDVVNNRLVANFMEPRAAIGEYDAASGAYTLTTSSQGVHGLQGALAGILKTEASKIRVVTPDVGGGFGTKAFIYREYPLLLEAGKRAGKPVRWVADRSEHFLGDAHGRDNLTHAEMALDKDGKFLALRVDIRTNLGAYLSQFGPYIPWLAATMATGPYDIQAVHARVRAIYTHTIPVDAYRGAGRPEAAYLLERLVDQCARALNMPREEIRAKNFVRPEQMPYKTHTERTYDVGEFEAAMRKALLASGHKDFAGREAMSRATGKIRGLGFASYIECTAWGEGENGFVNLEKDGTFTVLVGTQSNGQGHATAYAQMVAQHLDVAPERVKVVQGDTSVLPTGGGTGGSRSIPVGAVMVSRASEKLVEQLKELASEKLEAAAADLEIADSAVRVAGTDRAISYQDIARSSSATPEKLKGNGEFVPPDATYPNGTHVCEVEIDPDSGHVDIVRYSVCDDFGVTLNPLLLEGQVHGGVAQGIGQALHERTIFSPEGQLITATFMDYAIPRAADCPNFSFQTRNVPSTTNPLGLKGAGEAGSIGAAPAVMNAVVDALRRTYGIEHIDMPATPARIRAAIAGAQKTKQAA